MPQPMHPSPDRCLTWTDEKRVPRRPVRMLPQLLLQRLLQKLPQQHPPGHYGAETQLQGWQQARMQIGGGLEECPFVLRHELLVAPC